MEPVCQYCGDENPEWQLHDRATGEPGQAVCGTCLLMLRDAVAAVSPPAKDDDTSADQNIHDHDDVD